MSTAACLTAASLDGQPHLRHGFFTRKGGVSRGVFDSLNCGLGGKDAAEAVLENRQRAMTALGRDGGDLVTLVQVHSARVVTVEAPIAPDARPEADALVTRVPGLALGVLTADCAPLLFADPQAGVVGAAHAGWRGALDGVAEATLDAMEALGAKRAQVRAAVGPCIAQESYEVGPEFAERFLAASARNAVFFRPGSGDRRHFDLKGYLTHRLEAAGVAQLSVEPADTCADPERFFSYRRTVKRGERHFGNLLSAVVLTRE
ncbi:MAG: peptidoglycan editing factor PgeF [Rhodospirillales bacterium]